MSAGERASSKERARQTGVRGETYAYWYLRRKGHILMARNYTLPGIKGEIDMIELDGPVLAFVEVKTRDANKPDAPDPERAVDFDKRRHLARMARQFRRSRRMESTPWRFDVIAIETRPIRNPPIETPLSGVALRMLKTTSGLVRRSKITPLGRASRPKTGPPSPGRKGCQNFAGTPSPDGG